jgi:hypothetical protein
MVFFECVITMNCVPVDISRSRRPIQLDVVGQQARAGHAEALELGCQGADLTIQILQAGDPPRPLPPALPTQRVSPAVVVWGRCGGTTCYVS